MSQYQAKIYRVGTQYYPECDGGTRMIRVDPSIAKDACVNYTRLNGSRDPKDRGEHSCSHITVKGSSGTVIDNGIPHSITGYYKQSANEVSWAGSHYWQKEYTSGVNEFTMVERAVYKSGSIIYDLDEYLEMHGVVCEEKSSPQYCVMKWSYRASPKYLKEYSIGVKDPMPFTWYTPDSGNESILVPVGGSVLYCPVPMDGSACENLAKSLQSNHTVPSGLQSDVFRQACNQVCVQTNNIANALAVIDLVKDLYDFDPVALAKDLRKPVKATKQAASAWLGYRYAYLTTKSDVEEILSKYPQRYKQYAKRNVLRSCQSTTAGTLRCRVAMTDARHNQMTELWKLLKRYGSAPDLYNLWDLVPLSFVADWFLPIGDWLEDYSQEWVTTPGMFNFNSITMSWKWEEFVPQPAGGYIVTSYDRWTLAEPPAFESYSQGPSDKTVTKRWVDAAALLVGR